MREKTPSVMASYNCVLSSASLMAQFQPLVDDMVLKKHHIVIEIGRIKNKNKNPFAKKAFHELQR